MGQNASRALITGASAGIGAMYADRLARRGYDLVLVARRVERLTQLATQLKNQHNISAEVLPSDLSTDAGIQTVEHRLHNGPTIDILVNNAGIPGGRPITGASPALVDRLIDVNIRAVARLAAAAAALMKNRGNGAIVNIASVVGLMSEAGLGLYGPTKASVISLSQNLQSELAQHGVYVQAVLPAATRTDIWAIAGRNPDDIDGMMDVGDLVDAALSGFDRREAVTIPSLPDASRWERYEAMRREIVANVANEKPAARYLTQEVAK